MAADEEAERLRSDAQQTQQEGNGPEVLDHEVSSSELSKWTEMVEAGIPEYMRSHPDRFYRRVRRGIPPRFRWQVWKAAVRLQEYELPHDYHGLSTRENEWTSLIEIDISRTFPELRTFDATQQQRLLRVLNAYASYNPELGYCQGMNFIAGLLLLVSGCEEESFAVLVCLMDHPEFGLAGFYKERLPLLRRYLRICDRLVKEAVPELRDHFIKENVQPAVYLHQWFLTLFINCFPLSMVLIIWDAIVCEGLPVILRIAVSILQVLKDSLLSMHFEEIIKFFKMMKTYDDEDGELNAFRIGQLLMKHTEHVQIPDRTLEYLRRAPQEDDGNVDSDESWEADLNGGGWFQSLSRMFTFGATKRKGDRGSGSAPRAASAPELSSAASPASGAAAALQTPTAWMSAAVSGGNGPTSMAASGEHAAGRGQGGSEARRPSGAEAGAASSAGRHAGGSEQLEDESLTRGWEFL
mmetsp:Transcript_67131/g.148737  ORF Transcript_67131/g.148737 Transcript_67131/m.148737 type:complete len:467 (+) Transcript_67131:214-1614(+)